MTLITSTTGEPVRTTTAHDIINHPMQVRMERFEQSLAKKMPTTFQELWDCVEPPSSVSPYVQNLIQRAIEVTVADRNGKLTPVRVQALMTWIRRVGRTLLSPSDIDQSSLIGIERPADFAHEALARLLQKMSATEK